MRRTWARAGIGLLAMTLPALAETKPGEPAHARATTLDRLQAQLAAERAEAQATGARLAALGPYIRHVRAARPE